MKILSQYKGLRRELYILLVGRIVTSLGAMIWPVLTLILNQKMGLDATTVSIIMIVAGLINLPAAIVGGKIADKLNRKYVIVVGDIVSIVLYITCGFLPMNFFTLFLMLVASIFQSLEGPAYEALVADFSETKDRERAYSMLYLGMNVGLVASPTIAGLLFNNYLWLSFIISGVAIGISTLLIAVFIDAHAPVSVDEDGADEYQKSRDDVSIFRILKENGPLVLFMVVMSLYSAAYNNYGYLMPLDIAAAHPDNGAALYGTVSSMNCIVVVLCTPLFTKWFRKVTYTQKTLLGQLFLGLGYGVFLIFLGHIPFYYVAIALFTFGEIMTTLSAGPYMTERIPASHRGRVNGAITVMQAVFRDGLLLIVGMLYDRQGSTAAWLVVISALVLAVAGSVVLIVKDRIRYPGLYGKNA